MDTEAEIHDLERKLRSVELERDWWKLQYQTTVLREVPNIETALSKVCAFAAKVSGVSAPNLGVSDIVWEGGVIATNDAPSSPVAAATTETDSEKANRLLIESANAFKSQTDAVGDAAAATASAPATIDILPAPMSAIETPEPRSMILAEATPAASDVLSTAEVEAAASAFNASPSPVVVPVPMPTVESSMASILESTDADTAGRLQTALASSGVGGNGEGAETVSATVALPSLNENNNTDNASAAIFAPIAPPAAAVEEVKALDIPIFGEVAKEAGEKAPEEDEQPPEQKPKKKKKKPAAKKANKGRKSKKVESDAEDDATAFSSVVSDGEGGILWDDAVSDGDDWGLHEDTI